MRSRACDRARVPPCARCRSRARAFSRRKQEQAPESAAAWPRMDPLLEAAQNQARARRYNAADERPSKRLTMNARPALQQWFVWIAAALCLAAPAEAAFAQKPAKVWHIGLCHVGLDHEPPGLHSLHKALNDMGYVDGNSLRFDWRNEPDAAGAAAQIKRWVAENIDLIG